MSASPAYSSYPPPRSAQAFADSNPPPPPPKPNSQEVSRQSTPAGVQSFSLPDAQAPRSEGQEAPPTIPDPGEQWLPKVLQDNKQDLSDVLAKPELLTAIAHSRSTSHPSVASSQEPLLAAISDNISLASHLIELEARLVQQRSETQSQLLSAHAMERQWRQKQSDMDRALAPFSPSSLYQKLGQGVLEQEQICRAMEESFLEGDGGIATERETAEWVRRFRETKKVYYLRRERKERWDEGRVGGWR